MRLGFGLYRHMLDEPHCRFARQVGARPIVVHMCDYFNQGDNGYSQSDQPIGDFDGWGYATREDAVWGKEELLRVKGLLEDNDLEFFAIENLDPAFWRDVLFDGPRKEVQIENIKMLIRTMGEIGIPVLGYNFSLAGVTGRIVRHDARGGAQTVGMNGTNPLVEKPLPRRMAWNMVVEPDVEGIHPTIDSETLWQRLEDFLRAVIPVAEEAGVCLAAHPDDPPLDFVRGQPRLVNQPHLYRRLLDCVPSPANRLEFCLGTIAEMSTGDVYQAVEEYASRSAYIHFRNVRGRVPQYCETFIDEGDIDMPRVIDILQECNYSGVLIPDHSPQVSCPAPWHAGMAFAMGYMNALMQTRK